MYIGLPAGLLVILQTPQQLQCMILDWARIVLMQMVRLLLWMLVTMLPSMPRLATSKVFDFWTVCCQDPSRP